MVEKEALKAGLALLRQPVLPLVGIVQFLYLTGDFASVEEVIGQMPEEIETGYALYGDAATLLAPYADLLQPPGCSQGRAYHRTIGWLIPRGNPVDPMTATGALVAQHILVRELERINSLLCAPCGCTLCCVGPDADMARPISRSRCNREKPHFFPLERIDTSASQAHRVDDEPPLK